MSPYLHTADWILWAASIACQLLCVYLLKGKFPCFSQFLVYLSLSDVILVTVALRYSPQTYASAYYLWVLVQSVLLLRCVAEAFATVLGPFDTLSKSSALILRGCVALVPLAVVLVFVLKTGISTVGVLRSLEIGVQLAAFLGFSLLLVFAEFFGLRKHYLLAGIAAGFAFILGVRLALESLGVFQSPEVNLWLRRLEGLSVLVGQSTWVFCFRNNNRALPPKLSSQSAAEMLRKVKRLTA